MSRLPLLDTTTAPEASQPFVQKALANNGFLPNLIGVLAHAPAALETYLTVGGINAKASLGLPEREVVQLTAAKVHGCDFCLAGHTAVGTKKAGFSREVALQLQRPAYRRCPPGCRANLYPGRDRHTWCGQR